MNIMTEIQSRLKAPKGQTNKFGGYKYRSCEDIVEAVKPILAEFDCYLNITDEMVMLGDRYYIKATASIVAYIKGTGAVGLASSSGFARESLDKKGMDDSQITGAASSYARKYALNGLLAIDDTKDADATNDHRDTFRFKKGEKDEVMEKVLNALSQGDEVAIRSVLHEYDTPESKMAVWALFNSTERASIKALLGD